MQGTQKGRELPTCSYSVAGSTGSGYTEFVLSYEERGPPLRVMSQI